MECFVTVRGGFALTESNFLSVDPWSAHGGVQQLSVCGKFSGIGEDDLCEYCIILKEHRPE
jgi:hypothetical protein